jgi:hypothetical protein
MLANSMKQLETAHSDGVVYVDYLRTIETGELAIYRVTEPDGAYYHGVAFFNKEGNCQWLNITPRVRPKHEAGRPFKSIYEMTSEGNHNDDSQETD